MLVSYLSDCGKQIGENRICTLLGGVGRNAIRLELVSGLVARVLGGWIDVLLDRGHAILLNTEGN